MWHPTRRAVVAGLASAPFAPALAAAPAVPFRAEAWRRALERSFALDNGTGLYREHAPARASDDRYATEWPFSQVHIAYLDLAMMPGANRVYAAGLARARAAQQRYWSSTSRSGRGGYLSRVVAPLGHGDHLFYDDNEWVGLAEVQYYRWRRDATSLRRARAIFDLVRSGWSTDRALPSVGGVVWTQDPGNRDRNTVSNMPAAQLGLRLHQITGERSYLDDALRCYNWTKETLQRRDGLYHDHLKMDGTIDRRVWTYNQGVPVGVNVLLYRAIRERRYLVEAQRIADAAHAWFVADGRIDGQPPPFNAIYFKNLLLLAAETGGRRDLEAMRAYADRIWRRRDPATGLVSSRRERFDLIDTAALVQIEAVSRWSPSRWSMLY